jgi:hypothetical protein
MGGGEGNVASLLRVLEDGAEREDEEALRAARRLLDLRAPEARPALVDWLARSEPGSSLYEMLAEELPSWGEDLVPALLEVLARVRSPKERFGPLDVLSRCGARDERIHAVLLEWLQEDPFEGAMMLRAYGDPRAVGPLVAALGAYELEDDVADVFAQQTVLELERAILGLGGVLDEPLRLKVEAARQLSAAWSQAFDRWRASTPAVRRERPGRNDACWCGSGVKYKKCHLDEDR